MNRLIFKFLCFIFHPIYYFQDVRIHPLSKLGKSTTIGTGTNINGPCRLESKDGATISIGRNCGIGYNLVIRVRNHKMSYLNMQDKFANRHNLPSLTNSANVEIGDGCWIGDNVIILPGVNIGEGAVIGAGSIVSKSLPPYSVSVGTPAKVIRYRFSEQKIKEALLLKWHDWDEKKIIRNIKYFNEEFEKINNE